jgi:hypothetical protein
MPYVASEDPYASAIRHKNDFGEGARAITPSDADANNVVPYAKLYLLTAGTVSVVPAKNTDATPMTTGALPAGHILPWVCRRVLSTGTTATVATIDPSAEATAD